MRPDQLAAKTDIKMDTHQAAQELAIKYNGILDGFSNLFYKCRAGVPQEEKPIKALRIYLGDQPAPGGGMRSLFASVETSYNGIQAGRGKDRQLPDDADGFTVKFLAQNPTGELAEMPDIAESFIYPGARRLTGADPYAAFDTSDWRKTEWHAQPPTALSDPALATNPAKLAQAKARLGSIVWPQIINEGLRYPDLESLVTFDVWLENAEPAANDTLTMLMNCASDPVLNPHLAPNIAAAP